MLNYRGKRATANLRMLELVARKLGPLNDEVVYLGGCSTALFITDSLLLDVRPTILDVMPTDEKILMFGNRWYKDAILKPIIHQLADDLSVSSISAPYLLATKIEAFKTRGNGDFLASHDFEDIINIISGRVEIAEEVNLQNDELKSHLKNFFEEILKDDEFITALPAHINEGPATEQRLKIVTDRIKKIAGK
jgi:hypothetical protein